MAKPSESDFNSYLSVAKWLPQVEWIAKTETIDPSFDYIKPFLREIQDAKYKHFEAAYTHDVMRWFKNQPSVRRAMTVVDKRNKLDETFSKEENLNRQAQRFVDYYSEGNSDFWRYRLRRSIEETPLGMCNDLINAFYDYFYTDRWQQTVQMGRDAQKTLERAIKAIETLEKIQIKMAHMEEFYMGRGGVFLGSKPERMKEKVNQVLLPGNFVFPTAREDETTKERVLVFDLSRLFRRHFRSDKPTAIFHLMMTEGVAHSLDQRTIERMLEQWRNKKKDITRRLSEK